jgi:hypothetical protein
MQALLRDYLPSEIDIQEKVRLTRELLDTLPPTNSFFRDLDQWRYEISEDGFGDSGLYDLLLHSQDRCFDVGELYDLAASAELDLLSFVDRLNAYNPFALLPQGGAGGHLKKMKKRDQQAVAELMLSDLNSHEFYLGRTGRHQEASLSDENNTLVLMGKMHGQHAQLGDGLLPGRELTFTGRGGDITVTGTAINRVLFANMDGVTPLSRIYKRVQKKVRGVSEADVKRELHSLYKALHSRGYLYLLSKGSYGSKVPDYSAMQPF